MSAKMRMTLWFTLMVIIMAAMVLVFVLVINANSITDDPAGRLVSRVLRNADQLEFDHGHMDYSDVKVYSRGVFCTFYDEEGRVLLSADPEGVSSALPLEENIVRSEEINGEEYYVYDARVDMGLTGVWVRGIVSATDRSGLMNTILTLTITLLPVILIVSIGGGWLIASLSFRPMEKIVTAANDISDGGDLTKRIGLRRGAKEMRRLGQAFDRMFGRLEQSFNQERQFASDASHELRTPITIILAQCDRSRRKDKTSEDFLDSIGVIEEQAQHMSELVQQLLGLTRMQHGTDRYPIGRSSLSEFVESCCGEFIPADRRGIALDTDIQSGIEYSFNPALMSRVVQNLLQNAYKYGRDDGSIRLTLRESNGEIRLSVKDDGIGIAREDLDKVWLRFWQADGSRGEDGGSGLGLAMVKEIAEFHHGRAEVQSEVGRGSTFTVILPK